MMGMFLSMFLKIEKEKREEYKEDKENNVKKQKITVDIIEL